MIIILKNDVAEEDVRTIVKVVIDGGFREAKLVYGCGNAALNCLSQLSDNRKATLKAHLESLPNVEAVMIVDTPLRLVSRKYHLNDLTVQVNDRAVGGNKLIVIAGPCAVENKRQILAAAKAVKDSGADMLRGGAFKPRTSPYEFQGLEERGLKFLAEAKQATGLPIVTEVMCSDEVGLVAKYADVLQVGARNMQNFQLLKTLGRIKKPVLLKRGLAATLDEFLGAAEYILAGGNNRLILCLRGVGGKLFASGGKTRNIPDLGDLPVLKGMTHLPVLFDPSHAGGRRELVEPLSLAAICLGADGLIIEVHPDPDQALCDGAQSLNPVQFAQLMVKARVIAKAVGKS